MNFWKAAGIVLTEKSKQMRQAQGKPAEEMGVISRMELF